MDKKELYLSVLDKIKSKDKMRRWLCEPFNAFGKTMTSNGYSVVTFPSIGDYQNLEEKVGHLFQSENNMRVKISLEELKTKLSEFPLIDCFDEEENECDACDGEGEVEFEFDYKFKTYTTSDECPMCEGEGVLIAASETPNGKKELDYGNFFGIGDAKLNLARIEELIFVAETLGEEIYLVYQEVSNKPIRFLIGEADVVLMPSCGGSGSVLQKIEI